MATQLSFAGGADREFGRAIVGARREPHAARGINQRMTLLLLDLLRRERKLGRPVVDALPASAAAYQQIFSRLQAHPGRRFGGIAPIGPNCESNPRIAKGLLQILCRVQAESAGLVL